MLPQHAVPRKFGPGATFHWSLFCEIHSCTGYLQTPASAVRSLGQVLTSPVIELEESASLPRLAIIGRTTAHKLNRSISKDLVTLCAKLSPDILSLE